MILLKLESAMTATQPTTVSKSWQGKLELEFRDQSAKTILSRSLVQAPLKVQRPFYPEGDEVCHSVMLHTAGGIVGGDQLSISAQLQPHAQALITNAAATKVYRSNGTEAQHTTHLQIGSNACLEWLPQETIVFDGALYRQHLKVELAAGASWIGWDVTRLGRTARGERFASGEWHSHTEVWHNNQLIWVDPQWILGGSDMIDSPHGLAGCPVIGSLAFVGQAVSQELVEKARLQWEAVQANSPPAQIGITRLPLGLLCRYRGNSTAAARKGFVAVWQLLRQEYLERSVCIPRVWTQ
jgi:urease accessory protein